MRHIVQSMWRVATTGNPNRFLHEEQLLLYKHSTKHLPHHQQTRSFAGHNKWSKIRHKKGAKDVSRGKEFAKATRAIRAASRLANGDMSNLTLQSSISRAKSLQVPKDRILDAIHGTSKGNEEDLMSMRYDCRISTSIGKVNFIILTLTNNKNRTFTNIRTAVSKAGGEILNTGANNFLFDHVGVALIHKKQRLMNSADHNIVDLNDSSQVVTTDSKALSEDEKDEILGHCLEAGADDIDFGVESDEHFMIQCLPNDLHSFVTKIRSLGFVVSEFESRYIPTSDSVISLDPTSSEELSKFLDKLDEEEDVSSFYHTASVNDD